MFDSIDSLSTSHIEKKVEKNQIFLLGIKWIIFHISFPQQKIIKIYVMGKLYKFYLSMDY